MNVVPDVIKPKMPQPVRERFAEFTRLNDLDTRSLSMWQNQERRRDLSRYAVECKRSMEKAWNLGKDKYHRSYKYFTNPISRMDIGAGCLDHCYYYQLIPCNSLVMVSMPYHVEDIAVNQAIEILKPDVVWRCDEWSWHYPKHTCLLIFIKRK